MSKLTDDEIRRIELTVHGYTRQPLDLKAFARAIEAAATEPLLQRIAELERLRSEDHAHAIDMAVEIERLKRQLEEARKQALKEAIEAAHGSKE